MNKIIATALLLSAGTALSNAGTVNYSLFSSAGDWSIDYLRSGSDANHTISVDETALTLGGNPNWKRGVASFSFSDPLALTAAGDSLSFSFSLSSPSGNAVGTVALLGTTGDTAYTVASGITYSGSNGANTTHYLSGYCNDNSASAYLLNSDSNWDTYNEKTTVNITDSSALTTLGAVSTTAAAAFSGTVSWQADQFVMTLTQGDVSATYELGASYSLSGIAITFDGGPDGGVNTTPTISNLTVAYSTIPEPSAFGLLAGAGALALVAARRRRSRKA